MSCADFIGLLVETLTDSSLGQLDIAWLLGRRLSTVSTRNTR